MAIIHRWGAVSKYTETPQVTTKYPATTYTKPKVIPVAEVKPQEKEDTMVKVKDKGESKSKLRKVDSVKGYSLAERSALLELADEIENTVFNFLDLDSLFCILKDDRPIKKHFTALFNSVDSLQERLVYMRDEIIAQDIAFEEKALKNKK